MTRSQSRIWLLMAYAAAVLPAVLHGAVMIIGTNANSPLDWVSQSFAPRRHFQEFLNAFGPGDMVIMSWPGCSVSDPKLDRLTQVLRSSQAFRDKQGRSYFYRVTSGREVLAQMTEGQLGLKPEEAIRKLQGAMIGPDGRTTCVVITFLPSGVAKRGELVPRLRQALRDYCAVPFEHQHLAGPIIDGWSVDQASQQSLERLALPSAVVVFLACWWSLGSWRAAAVIFSVSLYAQAATLALIYFFNDTMNALSIVLPPLIQAVTVAGGIHVANYYFHASPDLSPAERVRETLHSAWLPCVLSAGTTVIGVGSLLTSQVAPIRSFGEYSALGVALATALLLILVPGGLAMLRVDLGKNVDRSAFSGHYALLWKTLRWFISRHHTLVAVGCLAIMAFCAVGIPNLESSVRIDTLFAPHHRVLRDYAWLEENVGPLIPVEVLVTCDPRCPLSEVDRFELVCRLDAALSQCDQIGATISAATFAPQFTGVKDSDAAARREALTEWTEIGREPLIEAGYLRATSRGEVWRLTGFVNLQSQVDSQQFLAKVRAGLAPLLQDQNGTPLTGTSLQITGIMPLVHDIQQQLMTDLTSSFASAFVMIGVAMTIAQGSVRAGLVALVPNVFPVVIMFGILGWMRIPLDIGSIMTASIALGIAVDDTLHYLNEFETRLDSGMAKGEAVWETFGHCGDATINASLVLAAGMGVFVFGEFLPTSRFAWLMAAQLGVALLGDIVLLPALLLSPLGRLFAPVTDHSATTDIVTSSASMRTFRQRRAA